MTLGLPFALAALATQAATGTVPPNLTLEQETAVRCSAAFAIVAAEQAAGSDTAAGWPILGARAREYFVRTGARLMDETGADRQTVGALFNRSAAALRADGQLKPRLDALRTPCLAMLDLAVPAA